VALHEVGRRDADGLFVGDVNEVRQDRTRQFRPGLAAGDQPQNRIRRSVVPRERLADPGRGACDDDLYFFFLAMSTT
jgi:hypothetical protein